MAEMKNNEMEMQETQAAEAGQQAARKNVYISLHKNFVREGIKYTDKATGEEKTFNQVRLPSGTTIDGKDVGGYEFSPLYVNESKFRGENWRDIPLLADREVWLQKSVLDAEGNPVIGEDGRRQKDTVKVTPDKIKDALAESRKAWAEEHKQEAPGLEEKASQARDASDALENDGRASQDLAHDAR